MVDEGGPRSITSAAHGFNDRDLAMLDVSISAACACSCLLLALPVAALGGCSDPVVGDAIAALGPEIEGVPEGPLHRPGQPCNLCHDGGEARVFALAGTVFATSDSLVAAPANEVRLVDSLGATFTATTNCAGNFFVLPEDFFPKYPVWVTVARGEAEIEMESPIGGEGACASCHEDPVGPGAVGHVYGIPSPTDFTGERCP